MFCFLCFLQTVTIPVVCDTAHVRSLVVVGLGIALPANVHDTPKTKEACGVWGSDVGTVWLAIRGSVWKSQAARAAPERWIITHNDTSRLSSRPLVRNHQCHIQCGWHAAKTGDPMAQNQRCPWPRRGTRRCTNQQSSICRLRVANEYQMCTVVTRACSSNCNPTYYKYILYSVFNHSIHD